LPFAFSTPAWNQLVKKLNICGEKYAKLSQNGRQGG
jgi:hypothetical protein